MVASNPPADPPMPTIGQCKSFLAGFELDFALVGFDREDFVLLGFLRPRGAALLVLRLAGIGPRYVSHAFCVLQDVNWNEGGL